MPTKTITLDIDAYEKLRCMKRGKESFSAVVRRARFDEEHGTGARILEEAKAIYGAQRRGDKKALEYLDKAAEEDTETPRISPDPWN